MVASTRMLNTILDHMLQLLPDEPADSKRLDDIQDDLVDADASASIGEASVIPGSGVQPKLRVAS